jgi:hypothetical protein
LSAGAVLETRFQEPLQVRTVEAGLTRIRKVCALRNSSSDSIYFFLMERLIIRQSMQLIVSFPKVIDPSAVPYEWPVEILRHDSLPGRFGVAAKLLHNLRLRLRDGLIVPETGFWSRWPLVSAAQLNAYA